jgi:hypothetical protein
MSVEIVDFNAGGGPSEVKQAARGTLVLGNLIKCATRDCDFGALL